MIQINKDLMCDSNHMNHVEAYKIVLINVRLIHKWMVQLNRVKTDSDSVNAQSALSLWIDSFKWFESFELFDLLHSECSNGFETWLGQRSEPACWAVNVAQLPATTCHAQLLPLPHLVALLISSMPFWWHSFMGSA